jgi:dephospho-CoA kinase
MKIAITGGIATGKSTVLRALAEMGHSVASADDIARQLFGLPEFQSDLGRILGLSLPIDASAVRAGIGSDPQARRAVNRLFHSAVLTKLFESPAVFCEIPLLIEVCAQEWFDQIWVVDCAPQVQMDRLKARYGPDVDIAGILESQFPSSVKVAFADRIIRTDDPSQPVWALLSFANSPADWI